MPARESHGDGETRRHVANIAAPPAHVDVIVVGGPSAGLRASLDPAAGKVLVGTSALCDVRLTDPTVSRRHASIELTDFGTLVTDLGSTNGTFLGDARIVAAYLVPGAVLRVGSALLEARPGGIDEGKPRHATSLGRMASSSPRMINVLTLCRKFAPTNVPIVIEGETGTGKELLAESIHEASGRAAGPFVVLDCRTTPRELVEAYLFGEVRPDGQVRAGIFESASGGTLLVDEPGDLAVEVQGKLLRVLDKGVVQRLGSSEAVKVDVRVVVATANDLDKLVDEGKLRDDLYHRLAGARIELPPLRRRREDIALLAAEFWTELGGKGLLPDEFLERFDGYDWPGNVREVERSIARFLALGDSVSLLVSRSHRHAARPELPGAAVAESAGDSGGELAQVLAANLGYSEARERVLELFERAYLERALAESGGNVAAAAAKSGIARRHFQRLRARQK